MHKSVEITVYEYYTTINYKDHYIGFQEQKCNIHLTQHVEH